jgi:DNA processing protein
MLLVGTLASYIELIATRKPGERSPELLALSDEELARAVAGPKGPGLLDEVGRTDLSRLTREVAEAGAWTVCRHNDLYPAGLRHARDAPPALAGRGEPELLARLEHQGAVTVVGSRRATSYGHSIARSLGRGLASAGMAVVSGMALGIDAAAHRGALDAGITVAVLGCGVDVPYPRHHHRLYDQICERGLVLSELPPGTAPWKWAFPARNRIMAALGSMTIVVEAARRSGSLITAELAGELGRDVGAVPGPVGARMSTGANQLLADGARVVRDSQDVLDALIGPGAPRVKATGPALEPALARVLDCVERGQRDPDSIALGLRRTAQETSVALVRLVLLGYVEASLSGTYSRTELPRPDGDGSGS